MITFRNSTVFSFVLLLLLSSACSQAPTIADGQVVGLQVPTTIKLINSVISGAPGTRILIDPSATSYILSKPVADGVGFVILNPNAVDTTRSVAGELTGNITTIASMNDLESYLMQRGWKVIAAAELPEWVRMLGQAGRDAVKLAGYAITTIVVVPAGIFITPEATEIDG